MQCAIIQDIIIDTFYFQYVVSYRSVDHVVFYFILNLNIYVLLLVFLNKVLKQHVQTNQYKGCLLK